jgi:hypothetical protein
MADEPPTRAPAPSDVISALNRTGFLLEYQVAQVLRERGFTTYLNYPYPDPETGKSREMDVRAGMECHVKRQPVEVYVSVDLVIECKNTPNPFVLIGERGPHVQEFNERILVSFDPLKLNFPDHPYEAVRFTMKLDDLPGMLTEEDFAGRQLLRMNRVNGNWRADNNEVYDSVLYPLLKMSQHLTRRFFEDEDEDTIADWEYPNITFILPIIVTSGPVLTVTITDNGPLVDEVGWAALGRTFHSGRGFQRLRVDVVSFKHFDEYLRSRMIRVFESAQATIRSNIHLYDPEWLLANRGEPEDIDFFNSWLSSTRESRDSSRKAGSKNS